MTISTDIAQLTTHLRTLIAEHEFDSTVDKYLDETFRSGNRDTFYSKTLEEEGLEAAEAELAEWATRNSDPRVGNALAPIVDAIACVLETGHRNVAATWFMKNDLFPFPYYTSNGAFGVVLYNPSVPGCGCSQPAGTGTFSRYGELGITSFVVIVDPARPEENTVVLMLPIRDTNEKQDGFVAVMLRRNGEIEAERREIKLYENAMEQMAFGNSRPPFSTQWCKGGSPSDYVGFPGAQEYITSRLGKLPKYLKEVADQLNNPHQH